MSDTQNAAASAAVTNTTEETKGETLVDRSQIEDENAQQTNAAAPALRKEPEPELATTKAPTEEDLTVTDGAFVPFRFWANQRIRNSARQVTLDYAGERRDVTEITPDGQVRLQLGEEARLIPFDERVIPQILEQLL